MTETGWADIWCVRADATTFRSLLRHTNVAMQPEGFAGITRGATAAREAIYVSRRKGFVRIAIQASSNAHADLVTVFICSYPSACLLCGCSCMRAGWRANRTLLPSGAEPAPKLLGPRLAHPQVANAGGGVCVGALVPASSPQA